MKPSSIAFALSLLLLQAAATAFGQNQPPADSSATDLSSQIQRGPVKIALRDQASLDLSAEFRFLPEKPAAEAMKKMGNETDENFIGIVLPAKEDSWFVIVEYVPSGYIKDDDARSWNADDLLQSIRSSTDEGNKRRASAGIPALDVIGWVEKPRYDETNRRLVWSIEAREHGAKPDADSIINYKALMLGREGYVSMMMVTQRSDIERQKPVANLLLSKLDFQAGKRYADFNASTDHIAEYGLAALVAGVAAKKLGLLAVAGAFLLKFAKVGVVAVVAGFAAIRRIFRRRTEPAVAPPGVMAPAATPAPTSPDTQAPQ